MVMLKLQMLFFVREDGNYALRHFPFLSQDTGNILRVSPEFGSGWTLLQIVPQILSCFKISST